ncbi:MAG: DNA polymerase III subunit gamma/tau [Pseudomonadota bacterium]
MSYQVLARKWRPRNFKEMVGQEHVLRALVNALDNNRLHHAFLFTGTRGVGKTTISRILAKSLNCEQGVSASPCGTCASCREIDEGRFVDLIEVDAASRTKVEDTRELLENVQYAPTRGRYKVYLIDEVHMLSTHSFNALLKTLEEPPPHVKFLLATTDPQKLPVTILSRCLQFSLRRLPQDMIAKHLAYILGQEAIPHQAGALALIAHAADGSMRDALSLLDQAIAFGGNTVNETEVRNMLGTIDRSIVFKLLEALAAQDGAALIGHVRQLAEQAPDFQAVLAELLSALQRIALHQCVPTALEGADDLDQIAGLSKRLSPEDVQLYYQIALHGRRDLPLAPDARSGLEMTLLRMLAFRPGEPGSSATPVAPLTKPVATGAATPSRPQPPQSATPATAPTPTPTPAPAPAPAPAKSTPGNTQQMSWPEIVAALDLKGLVQQLALNCTLQERNDQRIALLLDSSHAQLLSPQRQEQLQTALNQFLGTQAKLTIGTGKSTQENPAQLQQRQAQENQASAVAAIESDRNVLSMRELFNAEVNPNSIRPAN